MNRRRAAESPQCFAPLVRWWEWSRNGSDTLMTWSKNGSCAYGPDNRQMGWRGRNMGPKTWFPHKVILYVQWRSNAPDHRLIDKREFSWLTRSKSVSGNHHRVSIHNCQDNKKPNLYYKDWKTIKNFSHLDWTHRTSHVGPACQGGSLFI